MPILPTISPYDRRNVVAGIAVAAVHVLIASFFLVPQRQSMMTAGGNGGSRAIAVSLISSSAVTTASPSSETPLAQLQREILTQPTTAQSKQASAGGGGSNLLKAFDASPSVNADGPHDTGDKAGRTFDALALASIPQSPPEVQEVVRQQAAPCLVSTNYHPGLIIRFEIDASGYLQGDPIVVRSASHASSSESDALVGAVRKCAPYRLSGRAPTTVAVSF